MVYTFLYNAQKLKITDNINYINGGFIMENFFEKARELAEQLLETPEGKKYTDAKYIFEGNEEAVAMLQQYNHKSQALQSMMQAGNSGEELEKNRAELTEHITTMKKNDIITEMFKSEEVFNSLVNNVMNIFNQTLIGEQEQEGCGGGCGSCGGCH